MSDRLILTVWKNFPESLPMRALLQAIAEAANEQGNCYLTMEDLAAIAGMSRKNALRMMARLRDERWVVTARVLGQGGTLVYQLNVGKIERSSRPRHHETKVHRQRCRRTGTTEAGLLERVALRDGEGQPVTHPDPFASNIDLNSFNWTGSQQAQWDAEAKLYVQARIAGMKLPEGILQRAMSGKVPVGDDGKQ